MRSDHQPVREPSAPKQTPRIVEQAAQARALVHSVTLHHLRYLSQALTSTAAENLKTTHAEAADLAWTQGLSLYRTALTDLSEREPYATDPHVGQLIRARADSLTAAEREHVRGIFAPARQHKLTRKARSATEASFANAMCGVAALLRFELGIAPNTLSEQGPLLGSCLVDALAEHGLSSCISQWNPGMYLVHVDLGDEYILISDAEETGDMARTPDQHHGLIAVRYQNDENALNPAQQLVYHSATRQAAPDVRAVVQAINHAAGQPFTADDTF
ncbi:hypothetical protein ABZ234_08080 [Nocardiopsis sp. NPDC006198]|uniref:hypothetical protein n=1 Tax=Nocardiopsis sp. NPDC006198 TaxID=3154472 RepID=UPI0033B3708B